MLCLFCKQDSSNSKSIEHIIPESLGNKHLILPKGLVCDKCNNYFARKVEQPFFQLPGLNELRFEQGLANKKGLIPSIDGYINGKSVNIHRKYQDSPLFSNEETFMIENTTQDELFNITNGEIIFRAFSDDLLLKQSITLSRFIAKIAFECLALKLIKEEGWLDYLLNDNIFNPIRNYVRYGSDVIWPCNFRRIYDMNSMNLDLDGTYHQVLHETDFLLIPINQTDTYKNQDEILTYAYFIVALFGIEFAINIAGPEEDGLKPYQDWLKEHNNISPLYMGKNN